MMHPLFFKITLCQNPSMSFLSIISSSANTHGHTQELNEGKQNMQYISFNYGLMGRLTTGWALLIRHTETLLADTEGWAMAGWVMAAMV